MIKIALCDDETAAIRTLEGQINSFFASTDMKYTVSEFLDGETLLHRLNEGKEHFNIVFLDIKMNHINGMNVAKAIRDTDRENVFIVFVTALREYVFDAFDVSAVHYFIKPVETQKLHACLKKMTTAVLASESNCLILHKSGEVKKIPFCNILYCEAVNHRVFIYEKKNIHEYGGKMDDLEKELNDDFFRCHRSFIVNLKCIDSYRAGIASLPSAEQIPIAARRQREFMKALLHCQQKEVR